MENYEDEQFVRYHLIRKDFTEAIQYFEKSKTTDDLLVRDALIKIGIVTYAKPFFDNTGIYKEVRKFKVQKSIIPEKFVWLHEMLLNYRGNFIGHSNFNTIKPIVGAAQETPKGAMIPISYFVISYDHWFKISEEYVDYPLLIDNVIAMVKAMEIIFPFESLTDDDVFK